MNYFYSIVLGLIQGITEFLPVSSSGHLVIFQSILPNFSDPGIVLDVILHAGTLLAVLVFFRKKLSLFFNMKFLLLLAVASIPAGIFGFLFGDTVETMFSSVKLVGFALLLTGVINLTTDRFKSVKDKVSMSNAIIIGLFQALAVIPGVSRSGSTIFSGVFQKINRKKAAEFSFLLSVPAIIGANMLEITSHPVVFGKDSVFYLLGFISAFLSGLLAIKLVFRLLESKNFFAFGIYCILLGFSVLLFL